MRRLSLPLLTLVLVTRLALADAPWDPAISVVMISLDGLKPEVLRDADELGLEIPHLRSLMSQGLVAEGMAGILPTVTYPSHVTLFTGVPPAIHGIGSNHVLDPEDRGQDPWYWFSRDIRVPTLIDAAEAEGMVTGAVSWPATIGLQADYLMPEFWRGWSRHPFDRRFMEAFSSPGLLEAAGRFRDKPIPGFPEMTDRDRTDVAKWIIATAKPDLLLVHLFDLDFAQHSNGPGTPGALGAVEKSDALVGEILAQLDASGIRESTVVIVVSDHGFFPVHTVVSPNTLLVEAGLIRLDDEDRVVEWDAYFLCDSGSAALVLRDPGNAEVLEKVDELVTARAADDASGIFRVLRREDTEKMGSLAPLALDAASGYSFERGVTGSWSAPSRHKGAHGHAPDRKDALATLIISGAPLRTRGNIGTVSMTRVAPTVASILGLRLAPQADEPIPLELEIAAQ